MARAVTAPEPATAPPTVQQVVSRLDDELSLLSFNMLAPKYANPSREVYAECNPADVSWAVRWPRLQQLLTREGADIVCLQEVQHDVFYSQLQPCMAAAGYAAVLQQQKNKQHNVSVATFFKTAKLQLRQASHHSRTLVTWFDRCPAAEAAQQPDGQAGEQQAAAPPHAVPFLAVANVHLEGHPAMVEKRFQQLAATMKKLQAQRPLHTVVLGDFNCTTQEMCCRWLTGSWPAASAAPAAQPQTAAATAATTTATTTTTTASTAAAPPTTATSATTTAAASVPALTHTLRCAYNAAAAEATCLFPFFAGCIDHLFHSAGCQLLQLRQLPRLTPALRQRRLPDAANPSDHFPIGAVLRLPPRQTPAVPHTAAAAAAAAAADTASTAPSLELPPETEAQWRALLRRAPAVPPGKPDAAQLQRLRQFSAEKRALLATVPPPLRSLLKRIR